MSIRTCWIATTSLVLFCGALDHRPGHAQTTLDSVQVVLTAWESLLGAPPYAHPGGHTSRVCVERYFPHPGEPLDSEIAALDALLRVVRDTLRKRVDLEVSVRCEGVPAATFGVWMVNERQEPAVQVVVSLPEFDDDGRGRIQVGAIRGGRWARFVSCTVIKANGTWRASACQTDAISQAPQPAENIVDLLSPVRKADRGHNSSLKQTIGAIELGVDLQLWRGIFAARRS